MQFKCKYGLTVKNMNVIARLEYELAYYDSAVHQFNHYTKRTPPRCDKESLWVFCILWELIYNISPYCTPDAL